ncbi:MAG TPA: hypothetical protein VMA13_09810 [Candidatus Saccharimonadales bacterium]|nr:hypothetical protein [Candidatus Saccharimonadales bacterium]
MTPQEQAFQKAIESAMDRTTKRFVDAGFASSHTERAGIGVFDWNDSGLQLSRSVKKFFDVPNVSIQKIRMEDMISFVHLLLMSEPVINT